MSDFWWGLTTSDIYNYLDVPTKLVNGLFHLQVINGIFWGYKHVGLEYPQLDGAKQGRWKIHEDPYNCNGLEFHILFG